jgi:HlyD family secretion protein
VETSPQVFEKRIIKTGLSDGVNVEVLEGITKKEKIKIQNAQESAPEAGK